jgi:hypothetical protein
MKGIRSISQTGLQLCKTWTIMCKTTGLWKILDIKNSAKDSLGHFELKQHKLWFDKEC